MLTTTTKSDKPNFVDSTKIGDNAAQQPVSGISTVVDGTVSGMAHGAFLRVKRPEQDGNSTAA